MAFTQVEMMAALLKYETLVLDRMSSFLPTNAYYHPVIAAQEIRVQMAEQLLQLAVQHSPHHNKVVTKENIEIWKQQEDLEQSKMG